MNFAKIDIFIIPPYATVWKASMKWRGQEHWNEAGMRGQTEKPFKVSPLISDASHPPHNMLSKHRHMLNLRLIFELQITGLFDFMTFYISHYRYV